MHCGRAPACGVLALETGYGPSYYHHDMPSVHGLWPELPPYGNSPCLAPASLAPPKPGLPACYNFPSVNPDHQEVFVTHEWDKHGKCAGVASQADFFAQVCALAAAPLHVMADVRRAGGDLAAIANAVATAGFEVFSVDTHNSQLMLSACGARNSNGTLSWKLAATNQFDAVCGSGGSGPTPAPGPAPSPDGPSRCVPNVHGPPCADDAQCASISGCLRCARSGFCTSTPLPSRP
ncbi:hypothetical protein KFE25_002118 [Diacronema lutheri]|uniref:Uncharacterized protein n=1 Tax=Diacronema lutheri TaxID=2081491 RepID=A0A8J5XLH7_DIALT|nr:hypothetical protein KFE25_002118 [Diacronema lutheri]